MMEPCAFLPGNRVSKIGGDYSFDGIVVASFHKLSGLVRYVVEDDRGALHIYSGKNLKMDDVWKGTPVNDMPEGSEVELSPGFGYLMKGRKFKVVNHAGSYTTLQSDLWGSMTVLSNQVKLVKK